MQPSHHPRPPPAWPAPAPAPRLVPRTADILLAGVAHAAVVFGFVGVGFLLSLAISLGIRLYSRRSPFVDYHARQAGNYQCFLLIFNSAYLFFLLLVGGFNALYLHWTLVDQIALVLLALGLVWFVVSILFGVWAAILVWLGKPFAYPVFGRWARRA